MAQQDLIICKACGTEHGPVEAKRVVRFKCDHCQRTQDTEDNMHPMNWGFIQEANVYRFVLCPECVPLLLEFLDRT